MGRTANGATALGVIGIVLYALVGVFYLFSGLMVPVIPWLILLWAVWVAGIYPLVFVLRNRRIWTPLVAVCAMAFWWLYLTLGDAIGGWTA
ncbi:MAG: hypothetical protein PVF87_09915 [Acidimicrobiia bacterium]|jgi:hypothetical protein